MVFLSFFLSGYYRVVNRRIGDQGSILTTASKASFVDGILSVGILVGVLFAQNADTEGAAGFVPYLADSIITLIISVILVAEPIQIIRDSIIELALGKLQNKEEYKVYASTIREVYTPDLEVSPIHTSKAESRYPALAILRPADGRPEISISLLASRKEEILSRLRPKYPYLVLELLPR